MYKLNIYVNFYNLSSTFMQKSFCLHNYNWNYTLSLKATTSFTAPPPLTATHQILCQALAIQITCEINVFPHISISP